MPEPAPVLDEEAIESEFDVSVISDGGCFAGAWNDVY